MGTESRVQMQTSQVYHKSGQKWSNHFRSKSQMYFYFSSLLILRLMNIICYRSHFVTFQMNIPGKHIEHFLQHLENQMLCENAKSSYTNPVS